MDLRNFLTVLKINGRLSFFRSVLPAAVILCLIPAVYGTARLDSIKSAECLEKLAVLTGIPLFVPLLKAEQDYSIRDAVLLKSFPYRIVILIRIVLSVTSAAVILSLFEGFLLLRGCEFPMADYLLRTTAAAMQLGGAGLLISAILKNTIAGYLAAFGWYFITQWEGFGDTMRFVTGGISVVPILLTAAVFAAAVVISGRQE